MESGASSGQNSAVSLEERLEMAVAKLSSLDQLPVEGSENGFGRRGLGRLKKTAADLWCFVGVCKPSQALL